MCEKKKLDKIKALMIVANSKKHTQKNFHRKEIRVYFCAKCKAYHTTSALYKKINWFTKIN